MILSSQLLVFTIENYHSHFFGEDLLKLMKTYIQMNLKKITINNYIFYQKNDFFKRNYQYNFNIIVFIMCAN